MTTSFALSCVKFYLSKRNTLEETKRVTCFYRREKLIFTSDSAVIVESRPTRTKTDINRYQAAVASLIRPLEGLTIVVQNIFASVRLSRNFRCRRHFHETTISRRYLSTVRRLFPNKGLEDLG